MLNRIVTAFVLSVVLISAPTSAAPDGSLRKMLDTKITLIEYITLKTQLESVERLARGSITEWGNYSSVVKLSASFDYGDGELTFRLMPEDDHSFSTLASAKSYCRDLIREERDIIWILLLMDSTPNGWITDSLETDDFFERLYGSSKIRVLITGSRITEKLPENEYYLECIASLDNEGKVKSFSYNL